MNKQRLIVAAATAIAAITANANANVLEEVVVTSQKRSESLQDVPKNTEIWLRRAPSLRDTTAQKEP